MEGRLGADFSDVRVHTDAGARASAAEAGARAYTSGSHVVIGDGGADKETLAHELTHVIQQRQGPVAGADLGGGLKVSDASDRYEREAAASASRAMTTRLSPQAPRQAETQPARATGQVQRMLRSRGGGPKSTSTRQVTAEVRDNIVPSIIQGRKEDVELLFQKPGGWELWLQGEIYTQCVKAGLAPLAETKVYGTKERADLGFQASDGQVAIELKCMGFHNADAFTELVSKDREKIDRVQQSADNSKMLAIQIAVSSAEVKNLPGLKAVPIKGTDFILHWYSNLVG